MKINIITLLLIMHGAANADVIPIKDIKFHESYSDNVKVSGKYLVGAQLKSMNKSKSLHVLFPDDTVGNLCVYLSSIDGKYKATIDYKIVNPRSGLTRVEFSTSYKSKFDEYKNEELAISAAIMSECNEYSKRKILVSSWGSEVTNDLVLLIRSSARKDIAYFSHEINSKYKCKKFRSSKVNSVSYDKYCVLKGVDSGKLSEIKIIRKNLQPIITESVEFY